MSPSCGRSSCAMARAGESLRRQADVRSGSRLQASSFRKQIRTSSLAVRYLLQAALPTAADACPEQTRDRAVLYLAQSLTSSSTWLSKPTAGSAISGRRPSRRARRQAPAGRIALCHPEARREPPALRLPPGAERRAALLGGAQGAEPRPARQAARACTSRTIRIEYGGFEGIIPPKQYGSGTVMLWDRGTWMPKEDPAAGYRKGRLKFELRGEKLRGGWMLVRTRGSKYGGDKCLAAHQGERRVRPARRRRRRRRGGARQRRDRAQPRGNRGRRRPRLALEQVGGGERARRRDRSAPEPAESTRDPPRDPRGASGGRRLPPSDAPRRSPGARRALPRGAVRRSSARSKARCPRSSSPSSPRW